MEAAKWGVEHIVNDGDPKFKTDKEIFLTAIKSERPDPEKVLKLTPKEMLHDLDFALEALLVCKDKRYFTFEKYHENKAIKDLPNVSKRIDHFSLFC